jgi:hypothetical protein
MADTTWSVLVRCIYNVVYTTLYSICSPVVQPRLHFSRFGVESHFLFVNWKKIGDKIVCAFSMCAHNFSFNLCVRIRKDLYNAGWEESPRDRPVMNGQISQYIVSFSAIRSLHPTWYRVFAPCENSWKTWCFRVAWFEAKRTMWPLCRDENARKRR